MPNVSKVKEITRKALEMMHTELSDDDIERCVDYAWTLHDLGMSEQEAAITACKEFILIERSF